MQLEFLNFCIDMFKEEQLHTLFYNESNQSSYPLMAIGLVFSVTSLVSTITTLRNLAWMIGLKAAWRPLVREIS